MKPGEKRKGYGPRKPARPAHRGPYGHKAHYGVIVKRIGSMWFCKGWGGEGSGRSRTAAMVDYANRRMACEPVALEGEQ